MLYISILHEKKVHVRRPGIEPGSQEWESCMIPLHQRRCCLFRAPRLWYNTLSPYLTASKCLFVEMSGIEPETFHMQSERSTTELHPHRYVLQFSIWKDDLSIENLNLLKKKLKLCLLLIEFIIKQVCNFAVFKSQTFCCAARQLWCWRKYAYSFIKHFSSD